ncbi:NADPH-dependent FMN reductase [Acuticoccus sp.]|uniref:NADPH-dependent FMN reductase n=1 Tax=Acuticoccus sp. TaxID=1904378 RepID=UPI003B5268D2
MDEVNDFWGDGVHILAIAGSLRRGSYNRGLLHAAQELAPGEPVIEIAEMHGLPVFDEDLEREGWPEAVMTLRSKAYGTDGILFGVPEYNYGIAGSLKNAFDWMSRPEGAGGHSAPDAGSGYTVPKNPFMDKPCAMLGASLGLGGTIRAQLQLRQSLQLNGALTMPGPEVFCTYASTKFDGDARLTDDPTRKAVRALMAAFVDWIVRMAPERSPQSEHPPLQAGGPAPS